MSGDLHPIIIQVNEAKIDLEAADRLIEAYMPFIRSETAKFLGRPPVDGHDDELSIAMIAFHEAITGYEAERGSFLSYAATLIRSRLIDNQRRQRRHSSVISLDMAFEDDDDRSLSDKIADDEETQDVKYTTRMASRAEIEELVRQMEDFGLTLSDVADNCPKQQRTLEACRLAAITARDNPGLMAEFLRTRRLPMKSLTELSGVARKTLERHRKYIAALLIIFSNGYDLIRGHIAEVMR
ncbi:MAG: sigma-70 family RNA polymerase sigma factor [Bacillota bacterium]|nr:sigma-70 family RNA polymerase sigma factor [Bacillota bacterium]